MTALKEKALGGSIKMSLAWRCAILSFPFCASSVGLAETPPSEHVIPENKHAPPPEFGRHLEGAIVTLPLVLLDGYPFVDGAISGEAGKLLFDLGV